MLFILSLFLGISQAWPTVNTILAGSSDAQIILDAHNAERQRTVAGVVNGLPTAAANPDLVYSDWLAQSAATEVGRKENGACYRGHHPDGAADDPTLKGANSVGENIAYFGGNTMPLKDLMSGWITEQNCYTFGAYDRSDQCSSVGNCQCGHYTQMIWAATTEIGCAYALDCQGIYKTKLVCQYRQAGNLIGAQPFSCDIAGCPINVIPPPALPTCLLVSGMCCGLGGDYYLTGKVANGKNYYNNTNGYTIVWTGTDWALKSGTSGGFYATCTNNALVPSDCEWFDTNGFPTTVSLPAGCEATTVTTSPTTPVTTKSAVTTKAAATTAASTSTTLITTTTSSTTSTIPFGCWLASGFGMKALNGIYTSNGQGGFEMVKGRNVYEVRTGSRFIYKVPNKKVAECQVGNSWDTCTKWAKKKNVNAKMEPTSCVVSEIYAQELAVKADFMNDKLGNNYNISQWFACIFVVVMVLTMMVWIGKSMCLGKNEKLSKIRDGYRYQSIAVMTS